MSPFGLILLTTTLISSASLIGIVVLAVNSKRLQNLLLPLVSLSAGTLMGSAMLHLLPESINSLGAELPLTITLFSFIIFFVIEKGLHWNHSHGPHDSKHTVGYLNLFGDGVHNFLDGLVIAAAFLSGPEIGIPTAIAIALHEIPQELGDFGVLLNSGFSRSSAIIANLMVSATMILGGIIGYVMAGSISTLTPMLLPFAAGGFIYIASSDLLPELRDEKSLGKSAKAFTAFIIGVLIMYLLRS